VGAVVIGGLAVGAAIGTALRHFFGEAKAVRAEEVQAQGGVILNHMRAEIQARTGRPISAAANRALFEAYLDELVKLGFKQDARGKWYRPRSAIERLLG
jgi:hypothetical protein